MARYAAFISYAHRYRDWVEVLHRNLEHCLAMQGETRQVFLDRVDLGAGRSWVGQLQEGLDRAEHLVLVVTPEAMASPRVADEWASFVALRRDWARGLLHVAHLVDTPMPPFLAAIQQVDFRDHDGAQYRLALRRLAGRLVGLGDPRQPLDLPPDIEIPPPPTTPLPAHLRRRLIDWLASVLQRRTYRLSIATTLGLERTALEGYASQECAASAAIVLATGNDEPVLAAQRVIDVLSEVLEEEEPEGVAALGPLREELAALRTAGREPGLLSQWLERVAGDHERLVPHFQQQAELDLLERVYVNRELRPERRLTLETGGGGAAFDRSWGLRELLALDPADYPWITRRWAVVGDPGAGKTTLLRYLAGTVARQLDPAWVPLFESLPRLLRGREWLLDRVEGKLGRAGHGGLAAVLERCAVEGRLLLLLDGLDEVPREDRDEAEWLLRGFSARWPATPVVVTSRPIGYRRPGSEFLELELLPFDRERRRRFLGRWFGRAAGEPDEARAEEALAVLGEDPSLWELSGNPLYLTLMALLMEKGTSPERHRTRLYDQMFQLLLDGGHRPAGEPMECQATARRALRYLGEAMTADNRDAEPVTELEARLDQPEADELRQALERVPRWRRSLRPFLNDLAERTGILGPHDGPDADWRFWHRTFREALAAEALGEMLRQEGGEAALLAHAGNIEGDENRWAEPYALLVGRVDDADRLLRVLVEQNRALGLRALATAQGLGDETLGEILELTDEWQERAEVYGRIPELLGDGERTLWLLDRLRQRTRSGNDLFFLERAVTTVGKRWSEVERRAIRFRARLYDHIAPPPEELFRWVETQDGRVDMWREIPAGTFRMGSLVGQGYKREYPSHHVTVKRPFRMAAVAVTNAQYAAFDPGFSPYPWKDVSAEDLPHHPVVGITWYEAVAFCRWLSTIFPWMRGARLPTEEEWEYACRAGKETDYWSGDSPADLSRVAWVREDLDVGTTHLGGQKPANPWGLYDMHGNVWEWTVSPWIDDYSGREDGVEIDPAAVELADLAPDPADDRRVCRGGCCWDEAEWACAASRLRASPGIGLRDQGFRLVLPSSPDTPD